MPAGFEVRRSSGEIAVSSSFQHYAFIKRIKGAGNFFDTSGYQYTDHVLVFFVNTAASLNNIQMDGFTTVRFTKGSRNLWGNPSTSPPSNATLSMHSWQETYAYIFDVVTTASASRVGLTVFSGTGDVMFDASARYLKVLDIINSNQIVQDSYNYPHPAKVGLCIVKNATSYAWDGPGASSYYSSTWYKINGGSFFVIDNESEGDYTGRDSGYTASQGIEAIVADLSVIEDLFPSGINV